MTICLSTCLLVCQQDCASTTTGWIFLEKNRTMGLGPTKIPLNVESIWIPV